MCIPAKIEEVKKIPDSAVAIHGKREAQSLRSKVDGFVPLTRFSGAAKGGLKNFFRNDLTKANMMLKLQSRTPSLLQDCTSLPTSSG